MWEVATAEGEVLPGDAGASGRSARHPAGKQPLL